MKNFTKKLFTLAFIAGSALCTLFPSSASAAATPVISVPGGYGHYCSLSYASGGWAFASADASHDVCAEMLKSSPGGTIERAGLFSLNGPNNVVYRCGGGVGLSKGNGAIALNNAYKDSVGKKGCIFTVAPLNLPIFTAPFAQGPKTYLNSGFDFARGYTVQSNAGGDADRVSYQGNDVKYIDNHDGFDFVMPTGTPLKALANGQVLAARNRDVKKYNCQTDHQMEVFVLHTVGTGIYREEFVAYYAHLSSIDAKITPGATVTQGQVLGLSGNTGCSSEPHLHFGVYRFTNTATAHLRDHTVSATEAYDQTSVIDPWGFSWSAKAGFDPWAWRSYANGVGALSINLWQPTLAPKRD